jgi:hypothetical protein
MLTIILQHPIAADLAPLWGERGALRGVVPGGAMACRRRTTSHEEGPPPDPGSV